MNAILRKRRLAAIDIGSNAVRLVVISVNEENGKLKKRKLTMIRIPIRLGADVFSEGKISEVLKQDLMNALRGFSSLMKAYRVEEHKASATSAMRDAENGQEILQELRDSQIGIDVQIIDGKTEAAYIYEAGIKEYLSKHKNYLYIDVGGGSTELTLFINGTRKSSASFQLGTVRILKKGWNDHEWDRAKQWIKKHTNGVTIHRAIGSGGNINSYYKLSRSHGKFILTRDIEVWYSTLSNMDYSQRMNDYNLRYDRADVIVPAGKIFLKILREKSIEKVITPKLGLADGLINALIKGE